MDQKERKAIIEKIRKCVNKKELKEVRIEAIEEKYINTSWFKFEFEKALVKQGLSVNDPIIEKWPKEKEIKPKNTTEDEPVVKKVCDMNDGIGGLELFKRAMMECSTYDPSKAKKKWYNFGR